MTKIKLCGMRRAEDIGCVNELLPDYIGYIFWKSSKRYITPKEAGKLSSLLDKRIIPVGVFVDAEIEDIVTLIEQNIIKAVQLHGKEDNTYIRGLRELTECTIIQAIQVKSVEDIAKAEESEADYIMLDSGTGTGKVFDWSWLQQIDRPYFLAGGLGVENVVAAIKEFSPFGVDVSSLLETDGYKDKEKMTAFVEAVRREELGKL